MRITHKYLLALLEKVGKQYPKWTLILEKIDGNKWYKYRLSINDKPVIVDMDEYHRPESICAMLQLLLHLARNNLLQPS
jgi:hypothetical protein